MDAIKLIAVVLIIAGILALVFGGFSFTKEKHEAHIGSLELSVKEKEHVNIPLWSGVAAIVVGAGILLMRPRR